MTTCKDYANQLDKIAEEINSSLNIFRKRQETLEVLLQHDISSLDSWRCKKQIRLFKSLQETLRLLIESLCLESKPDVHQITQEYEFCLLLIYYLLGLFLVV